MKIYYLLIKIVAEAISEGASVLDQPGFATPAKTAFSDQSQV